MSAEQTTTTVGLRRRLGEVARSRAVGDPRGA